MRVASSGVGRKVLKHPTAGKLVFEHAAFRAGGRHPDLRLILYSAVPGCHTRRSWPSCSPSAPSIPV